MNKAVIELLEDRLAPSVRAHEDLDFLIGAWSGEEASAFDEELARQRAIDPELWK